VIDYFEPEELPEEKEVSLLDFFKPDPKLLCSSQCE